MIKVTNVKYGELHSPDLVTGGDASGWQFVMSKLGGLGSVMGMFGFGEGRGHRRAATESYGNYVTQMREYNSGRLHAATYSGNVQLYSTMYNARKQRLMWEAEKRDPRGVKGFEQNFKPIRSMQELIDRRKNLTPKKITGSFESERTDKGKNPLSRNENFKQYLTASKGPDKGSGNAQPMTEMYSALETRTYGGNDKDFRSEAHKKNFVNLKLKPGTKYAEPADRDMYNEKVYKSDVGLVRRVPRRYL